MTAHNHREYVTGCFRCDLSRNEGHDEALCICDYAHDTRDAADNAALKEGCQRFQAHIASLLAAARAEGAEKARAEVRERVEVVLAKADEQIKRLFHDDNNPREAGRVAGVTIAVRAALAGGEHV